MKNPPLDFFIFSGEPSGDVIGGHLVKALQASAPELSIEGVTGPEMRACNIPSWMPMENFKVMGFTDVFLALPRLIKAFCSIRDSILERKPKVVILIDYPGFNLRLAKSLRKRGFKGKIVQYVCPSIWVHGAHRKTTLVNTLDLLLCIFPFEPKLFSDSKLDARYVGHPILTAISQHARSQNWLESHHLSENKKLIALFPGSRFSEIKGNLPVMLDVCTQLANSDDIYSFALSVANEHTRELLESIVKEKGWEEQITLVSSKEKFGLMEHAYAALACCGTVTLELAMHEIPTVVSYPVSWINAQFVRFIIRPQVPFYCSVNIVAKKEIYREHMYRDLTVESIFKSFSDLLKEENYNKCKNDCKLILDSFGIKLGSHEAAKALCEVVHEEV